MRALRRLLMHFDFHFWYGTTGEWRAKALWLAMDIIFYTWNFPERSFKVDIHFIMQQNSANYKRHEKSFIFLKLDFYKWFHTIP